MGLAALINHGLNFGAPALMVAWLVSLAGRFFINNRALAPAYWAQLAILFAVNTGILLLGLNLFSHDGKMATYLGMAIACATSQWLMARSWRG